MPAQLFIERFLVTPSGPAPAEPAGYDRARQLSVDDQGQPFITSEAAAVGTQTLTEANAEASDDDVDDVAIAQALITKTQAPGESDDRASQAAVANTLGTETRAPGEAADQRAWAATTTVTFVRAESEDEDEDDD